MEQYYISITEFNLGDSAVDYLHNKESRITYQTQNLLGAEFWKNYGSVFKQYKNSNKLLFRAKVIKENTILIKQIWNSKESRDQFEIDINENLFNQCISKFNISRKFMFLNNSEVNKFIDDILLEETKILQYVCPLMQRPGMIIGDTLKGDKIIYIN